MTRVKCHHRIKLYLFPVARVANLNLVVEDLNGDLNGLDSFLGV